ncbi:type VI-C CRISPR-associated RNA-guided ribonuclease Cas13c [Fusibacter paucivorans]|uniref:Type VI-C CRISPR-associated RNA-guided ribonuclease Cas13c n=1 Tax=Fusibacter paucivorans TaxID=76009 RepID=A0ABS5PTF5_9FIRM|nr:type VI-C CRISPR-associated RNA-guided ribonuclease Cas13c [Fusibacter paucivorans]MBS7527327.1 type VI-C CRISPR-associated RNA-guided ribonuclease Cas13c [Fusibacter paucivorans]
MMQDSAAKQNNGSDKKNGGKQNKNSIVRIVISNFDHEMIKEIKVLYEKQGGVDTLRIDAMKLLAIDTADSGMIQFQEVVGITPNRIEDRVMRYQPPEITYDFDGDTPYLTVTKVISESNDRANRKYKIMGTWRRTNNGEIEVTVTVEDKKKHQRAQSMRNNRKASSLSSRVLLNEAFQNNISIILRRSEYDTFNRTQIDSRMVYKVKRFMTYRSQLSYYLNMINAMIMTMVNDKRLDAIGIENDDAPELRRLYQSGKTRELDEIWEIVDSEHKANNKANKKANKAKDLTSEDIEILYKGLTKAFNNRIEPFIEHQHQHIENLKSAADNVYDNEVKKIKKSDRDDAQKEVAIKSCEIERDKKLAALPVYIDKDGFNISEDDVRKIIAVFSSIRHGVMHYEYHLFDDLITGNTIALMQHKTFDINNLELDLFDVLDASYDIKISHDTTYLTSNDKEMFFGANQSLIEMNRTYRQVCDHKNGFNAFINGYFVQDGVENIEVKQIIKDDFEYQIRKAENYIKYLKNNKKNTKSAEHKLKVLREWLETSDGEVYFQDIHLSKKYKALYNAHKERVAELQQVMHQPMRKLEIAELNNAINQQKEKMEKMTKANAKWRLYYKLRVAFGYLEEAYNLNYERFKDEFNTDTPSFIGRQRTRASENAYSKEVNAYLDTSLYKRPKNVPYQSSENNRLQRFINFCDTVPRLKQSIFDESPLLKIYVLFLLFLPKEVRGDFLGFVKHHYYELKNVDFMSTAYDPENPKDQFFHKMRLIEKHLRHYNLFDFKLEDYWQFSYHNDELEKLQAYVLKEIIDDRAISNEIINTFNLNGMIIRPFLKVYDNIYQLCNMIELKALLKIANQDVDGKGPLKTIGDAMKVVGKGHLNFNELMKTVVEMEGEREYITKEYDENKNNKNKKKNEIYNSAIKMRNKISHFDTVFLFSKFLGFEKTEADSIQKHVKNLMLLYEVLSLKQENLDDFIINDYLMQYDQVLHYLKKSAVVEDNTEIKNRFSKKQKNKIKREEDKRDVITAFNDFKQLSSYLDDEEALKKTLMGEIDEHPDIILDAWIPFKRGKDTALQLKDMTIAERKKNINTIIRELKKDQSDERGALLSKLNRAIKEKVYEMIATDRYYIFNIDVYTLVHRAGVKVDDPDTDLKQVVQLYFDQNGLLQNPWIEQIPHKIKKYDASLLDEFKGEGIRIMHKPLPYTLDVTQEEVKACADKCGWTHFIVLGSVAFPVNLNEKSVFKMR